MTVHFDLVKQNDESQSVQIRLHHLLQSKSMTKLFAWGERGLVASYFQDVFACDGVTGWTTFFKTIGFPMKGRVLEDAWGVVEPDFGNKGFGHPDFVAMLQFDREPKRSALILEAKVGGYLSNSGIDRARKGFNSTINGQLELNHRLSLAFESYKTGDEKLVEPEWVLHCREYDTPIPDRPRYLKNRLVLERLVDKMGGLPLEQYHHVIVTSDESDPTQQTPQERRPKILLSETVDGWDNFSSRLHWTNWSTLLEHSANWQVGTFRANYEFMRCKERRQPVHGMLPPNRPYAGVSLIRLSQSFFPQNPPTYLYFSWRGASFRLRDFSGAARRDVHLLHSIGDVLQNREDEQQVPQRQNVDNYDSWHEKTLKANRAVWPELWPSL